MTNFARKAAALVAAGALVSGCTDQGAEQPEVRGYITSPTTVGTEYGNRVLGMNTLVLLYCQTPPSALNGNRRLYNGRVGSEDAGVPIGTVAVGLDANFFRLENDNDLDELNELRDCSR
jgi:hypothetical protein